MHLLRSTAIGTEIIDNTNHDIHGRVADLIIDPDRGKLIALLVISPSSRDLLSLQMDDVISWGNRIHIRDAETIGPVQEVIRLQKYLTSRRRIISQRIYTKSGTYIGKCCDVQFRTDTFDVEWIFPRRFFRKGLALPTSDILEVKESAIIVKDQNPKEEKVEAEKDINEVKLETAVSAAASRSSNR